jgi:hypothetical protein
MLMTTTALTVTTSVLLAILVFQGVRTWRQMRGTRFVICPETRTPAAVEIDVRHVVATRLAGLRELRLRVCSRWPEGKACGQTCLSEIEEAPHDCLVREVVGRWFEENACARCGRGIAPMRGSGHRPALKAADDRVWDWDEIPAAALPRFLESARAVCGTCRPQGRAQA